LEVAEATERAEGERYAAEHGQAFVNAHRKQMEALITTWRDADAEEAFVALRERFWARIWKPEG
jgi:hypothetical protein